MTEKTLLTDSMEQTARLFGSLDANIKKVERAFGVTISSRDTEKSGGNAVVIRGEAEAVALAARAVSCLLRMTTLSDALDAQQVDYAIAMVADGKDSELSAFDGDCICVTTRGKPIKAKTVGQRSYVEKIRENTIVMGVGPAGTGKTFLAVAMAVTALRNKEVSRIVLTRPAVEAGEKLGFLPGDLQNKIDPYLRPLYDALFEMLGGETYQRYLERGTIEIAPLAYMRGRTIDDAYIILDEAQNTTPEQMKMLLTRIGAHAKAIVTGDLSQTDLPDGRESGLARAISVLADVDGIAVHRFTERDVVRHRLVQEIILAYERYEKKESETHGKTHSAYRK